MKQNDAPVAVPNHVAVGTSTYGERTPPTTLPCSSSTGRVVDALDQLGARRRDARADPAVEVLQDRVERELVGKRLRGPSLQFIGGTVRPALTMSVGPRRVVELERRRVPHARDLVVPVRSSGVSLSGRRPAIPITKSDSDIARMIGTPRLPVSRRGSPTGGAGAHWLIGTSPTKPPPATAMK